MKQELVNALLLLGVAGRTLVGAAEERARYLRVTPKETVTECTFTLSHSDRGWSVHSITEHGQGRLSLIARYDARDQLTTAAVSISTADVKKACKVEVIDGKARVCRGDQEVKEFTVPPGVIVTSAPDWTDTFLLCRRYDRTRGGKQAFAGLWIHPEKEPLRLTFSIERKGMDIVEHAGKKRPLDRLEIRLRNGDRYHAWADAKGRMIKLQPLQADAAYTLVLDAKVAGGKPR